MLMSNGHVISSVYSSLSTIIVKWWEGGSLTFGAGFYYLLMILSVARFILKLQYMYVSDMSVCMLA